MLLHRRAAYSKRLCEFIVFSVGVEVLGDLRCELPGRFKNKREIVKSIGVDKLGQPTVNGKPMLKFRIEKAMPEEKK